MNTTTETLTVKGREFALIKDPKSGRWRLRKRCGDVRIDKTTGCTDLVEARKWARIMAETALGNAYRGFAGGHNLEEVVQVYLKLPKTVRPYVAKANVDRFRTIVRTVTNRELAEVTARSLTYRIWEDYAAIRHGGTLDLSTPRRENIGINSALRSACSIFAKKLDFRYQDHGIRLDFANLRRVPTLPVLHAPRSPLPEGVLESLTAAWKELKQTNPPMYVAVGLALHAGLRSSEVMAAKRSWLVQQDMNVRVLLKDRPEEGFRTKGKTKEDSWLSGIVLDIEFAAYLLGMPDGYLVNVPEKTRECFCDFHVNQWIRQFIPVSMDRKGLHRLRSVYADNVRLKFENQILARKTAIDAARLSLHHSSSAVTMQHYLTA